jgi:predicted dehydrogenase
LVDLGSHLIDMTLHLLGPIAAVAARTRTLVEQRPAADGRLIPIESDDVAWLQIELAGGGRGTIELSKLATGAALGERCIATFSRTNPPAALPNAEIPTATLQWRLASLAAYVRSLGGGVVAQPDLQAELAVDHVLVATAQSAARDGGLVQIFGKGVRDVRINNRSTARLIR